MPPAESDVQGARRQLDRVLASAGFSRNERMRRFLRFVVEQHLEGKDSELKESVIAVEVFGRRPDHDPAQDSIVRTEAGRLRARLAEYYSSEGKGDTLIIELPKGGYTPAFRWSPAALQTTSALPSANDTRKRRSWLGLIVALTGVVVVLGGNRLVANSAYKPDHQHRRSSVGKLEPRSRRRVFRRRSNR